MKAELPLQLTCRSFDRSNGSIGVVSLECAVTSAGEGHAGLIFCLALIIVGPNLPGCDIEELRDGTIRRAEPVGRSMQARVYQGAFQARLHVRNDKRAADAIQPFGPGLFSIGLAEYKRAGLAVEQIVKGVAVRHRNKPPATPLNLGVKQYGDLGGVPIVCVVGSELKVPL